MSDLFSIRQRKNDKWSKEGKDIDGQYNDEGRRGCVEVMYKIVALEGMTETNKIKNTKQSTKINNNTHTTIDSVVTFILSSTSISVILLSVFDNFMISIPQCDRCWDRRGSITRVSSSDAYDHTSAEFAVIVPKT